MTNSQTILKQWKVGLITEEEAHVLLSDLFENEITELLYLNEMMNTFKNDYSINW